MEDNTSFYEKLLVGAVAMLILFIMAPGLFITWISYEFLSKAVAIFFIVPLAYAIIRLKAPKEIIVVTGIGSLIYVIYAYILCLTFREGFETILQAVVDIVLISVVIGLSKQWMEKRIPP